MQNFLLSFNHLARNAVTTMFPSRLDLHYPVDWLGSGLSNNSKEIFQRLKRCVEINVNHPLDDSKLKAVLVIVKEIDNLEISAAMQILEEFFKFLRVRLLSEDSYIVYCVLVLLDVLVKNGGVKIHILISRKRFMKTLGLITRRLVSKSRLEQSDSMREHVADLALECIQNWGEGFKSRKDLYPHIVKTYVKLKHTYHVSFPRSDSDISAAENAIFPADNPLAACASAHERELVAQFRQITGHDDDEDVDSGTEANTHTNENLSLSTCTTSNPPSRASSICSAEYVSAPSQQSAARHLKQQQQQDVQPSEDDMQHASEEEDAEQAVQTSTSFYSAVSSDSLFHSVATSESSAAAAVAANETRAQEAVTETATTLEGHSHAAELSQVQVRSASSSCSPRRMAPLSSSINEADIRSLTSQCNSSSSSSDEEEEVEEVEEGEMVENDGAEGEQCSVKEEEVWEVDSAPELTGTNNRIEFISSTDPVRDDHHSRNHKTELPSECMAPLPLPQSHDIWRAQSDAAEAVLADSCEVSSLTVDSPLFLSSRGISATEPPAPSPLLPSRVAIGKLLFDSHHDNSNAECDESPPATGDINIQAAERATQDTASVAKECFAVFDDAISSFPASPSLRVVASPSCRSIDSSGGNSASSQFELRRTLRHSPSAVVVDAPASQDTYQEPSRRTKIESLRGRKSGSSVPQVSVDHSVEIRYYGTHRVVVSKK